MKPLLLLLMLSLLVEVDCSGKCFVEPMQFMVEGWGTCGNKKYYINGFLRTSNNWGNDELSYLEDAYCCPRPAPYEKPPTVCVIADWYRQFDRWVILFFFFILTQT